MIRYALSVIRAFNGLFRNDPKISSMHNEWEDI